MPQVISLANFHYIEKYFGGKKLEFLNASVKKYFPRKKIQKILGGKKTYSLAMPVYFPQQFCLFWTKVCGIRWN
jgi:ribosomal protein S7